MSLASHRPVSRAVRFTRSIAALYRERDVSFMAGGLAYAWFVSLVPLLSLLVVAASVFGGDQLRRAVVDLTARYLTPTSQDIVQQSLDQAGQRVGLSLVGGVALLWAVLKVFQWLDAAFGNLYGTDSDASIVDQMRDGMVVLGAMTTAVLAMLAVGAVSAVAPSLPLGVEPSLAVVRAVSFATLVVSLTVAFLPMYYVFPDVPMTLGEAVPGALVAAVGWTLLQALFQGYVSLTSTSELYGVVGGVILLVTWLYFGAVVLLLGVATNVVLGGQYRPAAFGGAG